MNSPKHTSPVPDLIRILRPEGARWGTIRAGGRWALSFPSRGDLLFFRMDRGRCHVAQAYGPVFELGPGDCLIARTCDPLTLASDLANEPTDSWKLVGSTRSTEIRVGDAGGEDVTIRGGRIVLGAGGGEELSRLFPSLLHLRRHVGPGERARAVLAIMEAEALSPGPLNRIVSARLTELLLLELFNTETGPDSPAPTGLLAGLADPVIARALAALHGDVARPWTTPTLARLCGCSRSKLSERFTRIVGLPPMTYLKCWRIALAKEGLKQGKRSVAQIALSVGFQSGSAFSTAFSRAAGCSPTRFAEEMQRSEAS